MTCADKFGLPIFEPAAGVGGSYVARAFVHNHHGTFLVSPPLSGR